MKNSYIRGIFKFFFIIFSFLITFFQDKALVYEKVEELPQVVITASRITEPLAEVTSEAIIITKEEIEKMNAHFVTEVLRTIPGIYVKQSGGPGKQASVFLETSTKSGDLLVMIDGIKVNSPTTGGFDFSSLSVDEIERIEIVKGPQSTLYGSEAMAGVINIITKKGRGKPKINLSLESGSYGTYKPGLNLAGGTDKIDYRITTFYYKTDGFSAYAKGNEKDDYKNFFISGKFGFRPSKKLEFEFLGRYYYDRFELDSGTEDGFNTCFDDPDYIQRRHHSLISGKVKLNLTSNWEQVLTFSKVKEIINTKDPDDMYKWWSSKITPAIYLLDWQHNFSLSEKFLVTIGTEYRKEKGKYESSNCYDEDIENKAIYLNAKIKLLNSNLILNGGARYDNHQTFGEKITYKIGFLYNLVTYALKIKTNYGTAFKAPTLNDLFWPNTGWLMGNPELKSEKSWAWSAGIEKNFSNNRVTLSLTYFYQKYKDLIQWIEILPWTYQPQNIAKASIKGFEVNFDFNITPDLKIKTGYTYLDTENKKTGKYLIYKPDHKFSVIGKYTMGKISLFADYTYTGRRYANNNNQIKLKSYSLLNLSATYKLNPNISFFGRIDNLLNTNYEEVKDYRTPDRSFYVGIRFSY